MGLQIRKNMMSQSVRTKLGLSSMSPIGVCIHNTANDASAANEITYMNRGVNPALVSYHYAVDNKEAVQGLPHNVHGWHAGDGRNGTGNRRYIAIEICYSLSGGTRFTQAERNGARLAAKILKDNGWGISRMKKHQDFSGKRCPHRTLDLGWSRFINMVDKELKAMSQPAKPNITYKKITPKKVVLTKDANLWNFDFTRWADAKAVKSYKKGHVVDVVAEAKNQVGGTYYMTAWSYDGGKIRNTHGFNKADTKNYTAPKPEPKPEPKPTPEPENCDEVKAALAKANDEISEAAKQINDLERQLNDTIDEFRDQEEYVKLLYDNKIADLKEEKRRLGDILDTVRDENDRLQAELANAGGEVSFYDMLVIRLRKFIKDIFSRNKKEETDDTNSKDLSN